MNKRSWIMTDTVPPNLDNRRRLSCFATPNPRSETSTCELPTPGGDGVVTGEKRRGDRARPPQPERQLRRERASRPLTNYPVALAPCPIDCQDA